MSEMNESPDAARPDRPDIDDTEMGVSRVEAFSDGVFSVAITLLVLNLQVPRFSDQNTVSGLIAYLAHQWPVYASYFISFLSIGSVWISHHQTFKLISRVDAVFQLGNILILLLITLLPFSTALLAEYLQHPNPIDEDNNGLIQLALIVYSLHWIVIGLVMIGVWRYVARGGLLKAHASPERLQTVNRTFGRSGVIFGSIGLVSAILAPLLGIYFYLALTLYYMLPLIGLLRPEKGQRITPR